MPWCVRLWVSLKAIFVIPNLFRDNKPLLPVVLKQVQDDDTNEELLFRPPPEPGSAHQPDRCRYQRPWQGKRQSSNQRTGNESCRGRPFRSPADHAFFPPRDEVMAIFRVVHQSGLKRRTAAGKAASGEDHEGHGRQDWQEYPHRSQADRNPSGSKIEPSGDHAWWIALVT